MIQFNLLPDVKQEYIKAKRLKHSVIVISMLTAAAALFIFVMLFLTVYVFQRQTINNLESDIDTYSSTLKGTKDLDKILTIQNQLKSLPELHDQKPVTSRLFTYVTQLTPAQVSIGNIELDYEEGTLTMSGKADSLGTINKFVDTLKFTTYSGLPADASSEDKTQTGKPFSEVVLTSFSKSDKEATYNISFKFNPIIFDSKNNITLVVPKIISTRSETEKPTELFQALPQPATEQQQ